MAAPAIDAGTPRAAIDAAPPRDAKVVQVVSDHEWTCLRRDDGRVRCAGYRFDSQNRPAGSAVPIEIPDVTDATDIYVSLDWLYLVVGDGVLVKTVLSDPEHIAAPRPVGKGVTGVARIASEQLVLMRDGTVRWSGSKTIDGTKRSFELEPVDWLTQVRDLRPHVALHDDGSVTWFRSDLERHETLDVRDVEALLGGSVARRTTGAFVTWSNSVVETRATKPSRDTPEGATMIAYGGTAAGWFECVLVAGTVSCRGRNDLGQLGSGPGPERERYAAVTLPAPATSISLGNSHACAVLATGQLACWGGNRGGQLGDGTIVDRDRPVIVDGATAAAPPPYTSGHDTATGSPTPMSWAGMPKGCTRPEQVGGSEPYLTTVSAYAYRDHELQVTFADFALSPTGYAYGEPMTRGHQKAYVLKLWRAGNSEAVREHRPTQPIDRGRYTDAREAKRGVSVEEYDGESVSWSHPGITVDLTLLTAGWACGTYAITGDGDVKPVRRPFAARVVKDPW